MHVAFRYLVLVACLLPVSASGSPAAGTHSVAPPPDLAKIRERISSMVERGEIPSMAVAVARGGETVWLEGIGWSDRGTGIAAGPDTVYAIGSTSKSLTATLAMALAERGRFDIDQPIDTYIDDAFLRFLAIDGRYPTIRELLNMTGGVPHGGGVIGQPEYALPRDEMTRRIAVVAHPPGTSYEYSNYSIGLVMTAMEHATGRPCAQLMRDYVFAPLGMTHSSVSYRAPSPGQALLYDAELGPIDYYRFYPEAAGGFYSSVSDLLRFALFHAGQWVPETRVISAENLAAMHTERPQGIAGAMAALGFGSLDMAAADGTWLISNGNVRGGNAHISIFPSAGAVVITAVNMTSGDSVADAVALDISDVLLPGLREEFGAFVAARRESAGAVFDGDPDWTGEWRGALEGQGYAQPVTIKIVAEGGISVALGDMATVAVSDLRRSYGSLTGTASGLVIGDTGRGEPSGDPRLRLSMRDGVLYGHIVLRIVDGDMRGNYPYRMRLTRQ